MLVLFLSWDLKYTGLMTNLGPVPFVPWGTTLRFGRSKTHNKKASTAKQPLGVGVRKPTKNVQGMARVTNASTTVQSLPLPKRIKEEGELLYRQYFMLHGMSP